MPAGLIAGASERRCPEKEPAVRDPLLTKTGLDQASAHKEVAFVGLGPRSVCAERVGWRESGGSTPCWPGSKRGGFSELRRIASPGVVSRALLVR